MRLIHVTHTNGQEAIILTDEPHNIPTVMVVEQVAGPLSNYNTIADYPINDRNFNEWPLLLPTERLLFPSKT